LAIGNLHTKLARTAAFDHIAAEKLFASSEISTELARTRRFDQTRREKFFPTSGLKFFKLRLNRSLRSFDPACDELSRGEALDPSTRSGSSPSGVEGSTGQTRAEKFFASSRLIFLR
jgi:hypothetical protein